MENVLQASAIVLLTVIMTLALGQHGKQTALLLVLGVCCMLLIVAVGYLEPVIAFVRRLEVVGQLDGGMLGILLKAVGIGLIGEIACLICVDSGHAVLGKALQMVSAAVILRLSLPMLEKLLQLLEQILGEV